MNVHKENEVMSKEFQLILALILTGAGFLFYKINLHPASSAYQNASFKTLDDLKSRGQIEVHSYEEWKKKNNVKSTRFEKWKEGKFTGTLSTPSPSQPPSSIPSKASSPSQD